MPIFPVMPSSVAIYRPFGTANLVSAYSCRVIPGLWGGRGYHAGGNYITWTTRIDVLPGADIRDGCGRTPGLGYIVFGDGDEARIASAKGLDRYVVVWVEDRYRDTPNWYKRCYLLRDTPQW